MKVKVVLILSVFSFLCGCRHALRETATSDREQTAACMAEAINYVAADFKDNDYVSYSVPTEYVELVKGRVKAGIVIEPSNAVKFASKVKRNVTAMDVTSDGGLIQAKVGFYASTNSQFVILIKMRQEQGRLSLVHAEFLLMV